ncbi:hypothetical protein PE067_09245 [Paracoccus sp. DMF-8]|uniref:hypothetical protein n=1 Tax=Paracoccus sp. DMF-8 TaxID=3019445 RepID=UPI0023E8C0CD|nr:hypothetical protein [Paracoccus sp. DMF-8]MDF3606303.1 hypothetical protein [Paracoccus sp. DMF-8]
MTQPPRINIETARGLLAGLGVEDIAVRGGFPVADVRALVERLRRTGVLKSIIRQARAA